MPGSHFWPQTNGLCISSFSHSCPFMTTITSTPLTEGRELTKRGVTEDSSHWRQPRKVGSWKCFHHLAICVVLLQVGKLSAYRSLLQRSVFGFDCQPKADPPVFGQECSWRSWGEIAVWGPDLPWMSTANPGVSLCWLCVCVCVCVLYVYTCILDSSRAVSSYWPMSSNSSKKPWLEIDGHGFGVSHQWEKRKIFLTYPLI